MQKPDDDYSDISEKFSIDPAFVEIVLDVGKALGIPIFDDLSAKACEELLSGKGHTKQ